MNAKSFQSIPEPIRGYVAGELTVLRQLTEAFAAVGLEVIEVDEEPPQTSFAAALPGLCHCDEETIVWRSHDGAKSMRALAVYGNAPSEILADWIVTAETKDETDRLSGKVEDAWRRVVELADSDGFKADSWETLAGITANGAE